jgi:epsin
MRTLRRLQEYNFFEGTADKGSGVREKSKQIIDLLGSNDAIRSEREKAKRLRNKFTGVGSDGGGSYGNSGSYGGSYGNSGSYGGHGSDSRYDSGRYDSGSGTGGGSGGRRESYSSGGSGISHCYSFPSLFG